MWLEKKKNSQVVKGRLVSLAVLMGTLFCSSSSACITRGKSPENKVEFLVRADRQSGLMKGCTWKSLRTLNPVEECGGILQSLCRMSWAMYVCGVPGEWKLRISAVNWAPDSLWITEMEGVIPAEYNGVKFVTTNCLQICFGEKIWAWPFQPLRERPQSVLDSLPQLEIHFHGILLPNPNIIFTNLLPAYS